jgi:hypothetical protein
MRRAPWRKEIKFRQRNRYLWGIATSGSHHLARPCFFLFKRRCARWTRRRPCFAAACLIPPSPRRGLLKRRGQALFDAASCLTFVNPSSCRPTLQLTTFENINYLKQEIGDCRRRSTRRRRTTRPRYQLRRRLDDHNDSFNSPPSPRARGTAHRRRRAVIKQPESDRLRTKLLYQRQ